MSYHHKKNTFLRVLFPRQFDTIPHIIIWSIVLIADIALVFGIGYLLNIPLPIGIDLWGRVGLIVYLCIGFALFCLESFVYNKIVE